MNEQIPVDPTERIPANQTSAVTRDAARLRSVMSDINRAAAPTSITPAQEELPAASASTAYFDTVTPAPRPQATELRRPAPRTGGAPADTSTADDRSRATRLRSVASLVAARQEAGERRTARPERTPLPMPADPPPPAQRAAAVDGKVRHLDIPIYEPEHEGPSYREQSGGSRMGVLMVLAGTLFTGLVVGVGLYAGGSDLVSNLFGSAPVETIDPNPAAITERPITEIAPLGAFDSLAPTDPAAVGVAPVDVSTTDNAVASNMPSGSEPAAAEARVETPRTETGGADVETETPRTEPAAAPRTKPAAERRRATPAVAEESPAEDDAKPAAAASSRSYTVQVRATPDESEARRIAKRLRGKGAKEVQVVRSEKNGAPLYRVRFKSYGTAGDAQAAAGRVGFNDAWIMKN